MVAKADLYGVHPTRFSASCNACLWNHSHALSEKSHGVIHIFDCAYLSTKSTHMSEAKCSNMMLEAISFETVFRIHDFTISLHRSQSEERNDGLSGLSKSPLTKPNFFFAFRAVVMASFQEEKLSPVRIVDTRVVPGLSEWCRKYGLEGSEMIDELEAISEVFRGSFSKLSFAISKQ